MGPLPDPVHKIFLPCFTGRFISESLTKVVILVSCIFDE
jgi:hypothetical protein